MSLETYHPSDKPSETAEIPAPPVVSRSARFNMSQPLPAEEEPAPVPPSPVNPETPEVSRANREAAPGRDDGLSQTPTTDDPAANNSTLPPVSPSLPVTVSAPQPPAADDSALPSVSPSLPVTDSAPQPPAASIPVSPGDKPQAGDTLPPAPKPAAEQASDISAFNDVTMPQKFDSVAEVNAYYDKVVEKFGDSDSHQQFLNYLQEQGLTLEDLTTQGVNGKFSNYLTYVSGLAQDAGIPPAQAGSIVHRLGELHTLKRYPEEIANGTRTLEQSITYTDQNGEKKRKELDRVTVRNGVHHIQDIKPIHLGEFAETPEGQVWAQEMAEIHGDDFQEQIRQGKLNPFNGLSGQTRAALQGFSKEDVARYKEQFETYRRLYQQANPEAKKVKSYVQPYYVW